MKISALALVALALGVVASHKGGSKIEIIRRNSHEQRNRNVAEWQSGSHVLKRQAVPRHLNVRGTGSVPDLATGRVNRRQRHRRNRKQRHRGCKVNDSDDNGDDNGDDNVGDNVDDNVDDNGDGDDNSEVSTQSTNFADVGTSTGEFQGEATWFTQDGNPGACGNYNDDSTSLVALQSQMYESGGHCGKNILVTNTANGKSVQCIVQDECPTCNGREAIDLSTSAFDQIGDRDTGILNVVWNFVE
jgi:hypothetical protein